MNDVKSEKSSIKDVNSFFKKSIEYEWIYQNLAGHYEFIKHSNEPQLNF